MAILEAVTSFTAEADGVVYRVQQGELADSGSPLVKKHPHLFRALAVHYPAPAAEAPIERAVSAPGKKRG